MIEITGLASDSGVLTKRIRLSDDGKLISDGSACVMVRGSAMRLRLNDLDEFAALIGRLGQDEAIALGALKADLPDEVSITTQSRLNQMNGSAPPGMIARTGGHIAYRPSQPALALVDIDTKGMPPAVTDRVRAHGGFWAALVSVLPELSGVARAVRTSTSSGITRGDTGVALPGSNGVHIYLHVTDGADVERFLRTLHDRCWLSGLGWMMVGAGVQMLERSLIDRMVFSAERLVFEGAPILEAPLLQDQRRRAPKVFPGDAADTRTLCPDLTPVDQIRLRNLKSAERARLADPADKAKAAFIGVQASRIVERTGGSLFSARRTAERQCAGTLLPDVVLPFDAEEFAGCTVADVLAEPERFAGATLADPLEGEEYGRCKAKIMRRADGTMWVNSFAHGRTTYELKHDAAAVETAIKAAPPDETVDRFVNLLMAADVSPDEEQKLRALVLAQSGAKARPLDATIKAARKDYGKQRAKSERDQRSASRTDPRLQAPCPPPDAERLPVLRLLDEALNSTGQPEPPMRDLDGHPVEVRCRPPMMLHELTSGGANQNEPAATRLPPPVLPLLTRHDRFSLAHEIERYLEFTIETEAGGIRPVALPAPFVDHFMAYRDSVLPRVGAIVTAPLVMPDGTLLAPNGLDRERKLVFRIEPKLLELMPTPSQCTRSAAADALDFLATKWLCDVATNFAGKCVLIALALTILERVLLPERPAFFVTAGKRGGGKTTAIMMVILAVTGKKPPAAAWSPSEEERRKAVLAYLSEGLAALVWDNIPLGTTISCPTIEKVLTAESYSDRILGQSANLTVPAFTIMSFTGNNIGPKGDMASRSLITRLEIDRPDPENRKFTHTDPVAWTLANRGAILRALYTIMLANPQLQPSTRAEMKTRFKTWWHLVGSAIENAAEMLEGDQIPIADKDRYASKVDFGEMFAAVEGDDEDGAALADVLDVLRNTWGDGSFQAADVAKLINEPCVGETDASALLRGFFESSGRRSRMGITPRVVSHRMTAMTDAPVFVGVQTMKLERITNAQQEKLKRAQWFRIRVL